MSNNNNRQLGEAPWLHVIISTGFGSGFFPKAPGTAGAFVGLVMWYIGYLYLEPNVLTIVTIAAIILTTFIGVWTSNVMEKYWCADSHSVVSDGDVSTSIPLLRAQWGKYTWIMALLGF